MREQGVDYEVMNKIWRGEESVYDTQIARMRQRVMEKEALIPVTWQWVRLLLSMP